MRPSPSRLPVSTFLLLPLLAACASAPAQPAGSRSTVVRPPAIHWARSSAEHRGVFLQTYRTAARRLRNEAAGLPEGGWAVILDADETVLDNSTYQARLAERGASFSIDTWQAWVREEAAGLLPGAADFIRTVREMGGRVVIVTNRDEVVCDPTRRNLRALGLQVDAVLCQQPGERGKDRRFRAVEEGTTSTGLPASKVVMWLGDNIHDFPGMGQEVRDAPADAYALFGVRYFLLPNPMYGSWEDNPPG